MSAITVPNDVSLAESPPPMRRWWTAVIAIFGALNLAQLAVYVPKMEKIFDDMVPGGGSKLPYLTQAILAWGRTTPLCLAVLVAIMAFGIAPLWQPVRDRNASRWAIAVALIMFVHFVALLVGLFFPLITVIQSMNQGG